MTRNGQLLLRHLLLHGRIECQLQFLPEISLDLQNQQMEIAVKHGIVRRLEETTGLRRTYYVVNPDYWRALKKVLPEALR
jgi:hypothetical protein